MNVSPTFHALALKETVRFDVRRDARPTRWPVVLCALVAIVSAAAAFTEGPLARRPGLAPYADALHGRAIELGHKVRALAPR